MYRIYLCVSLLITTSIIAQKTVKWSTSFDETKEQVNFNAKIEKGWHLYAIYVPQPDDGPLPTIIKYKTVKGVNLIDSLIQEKPIIYYDKNFGMNLAYYEDSTSFKQKVEFNQKKGKINGVIDYMTCNDKMCIPYNWSFEIKLSHPN